MRVGESMLSCPRSARRSTRTPRSGSHPAMANRRLRKYDVMAREKAKVVTAR